MSRIDEILREHELIDRAVKLKESIRLASTAANNISWNIPPERRSGDVARGLARRLREAADDLEYVENILMFFDDMNADRSDVEPLRERAKSTRTCLAYVVPCANRVRRDVNRGNDEFWATARMVHAASMLKEETSRIYNETEELVDGILMLADEAEEQLDPPEEHSNESVPTTDLSIDELSGVMELEVDKLRRALRNRESLGGQPIYQWYSDGSFAVPNPYLTDRGAEALIEEQG